MHSTWDYAKMILPYLFDGVLVAGAPMYFATLTEVPILQGLIGAGMRKPRSGVVFHSGRGTGSRGSASWISSRRRDTKRWKRSRAGFRG